MPAVMQAAAEIDMGASVADNIRITSQLFDDRPHHALHAFLVLLEQQPGTPDRPTGFSRWGGLSAADAKEGEW